MRDLLFLCHRIPFPPDKGEKIRAWHMLRHLSRTWRIHLGCFVDDPADWAHVETLRTSCADVAGFPLHPRRARLAALTRLRPGRPLTMAYFQAPRLRDWVDAKLAGGGIGHVLAYSSAMVPYALRPGPPGAGMRRVLDMVDVDSDKWRDYAARSAWPARLVWAREARTLARVERAAAGAFDRTLLVSADEARLLTRRAPEAGDRIGVLENGVDLGYFAPDAAMPSPFQDGRPRLLFVGTMDYWPNVDAAVWFAETVMPLLRGHPAAPVFCIVGASPAPRVRRLAKAADAVEVIGRVPDVRPWLAAAAAVVAPLRIARGVQNKVLEAMAMARPVIASPAAFEGIRARPGGELLVADGAAATAEAVAEVLDGRHPHLGAAARNAMVARYAWAATLAGLDAILTGAGAPDRAAEPVAARAAA